MRIRTVESLEALKRLAETENGTDSVVPDTVSLAIDAVNSHLKKPVTATVKKRNAPLEIAVELLRMETKERDASLQLALQTEKHFQQLFTASRLPIAIYDLSQVKEFLATLTPTPPMLTCARFVASRPDLAG